MWFRTFFSTLELGYKIPSFQNNSILLYTLHYIFNLITPLQHAAAGNGS